MKKIFIILGALAAVVGCQQVEELTQPEEMEQPSGSDYVAQIEAFKNKTKTILEEGNSIVWSSGDQIAIFQGADVADRYQIKSESEGSANGTFELVSSSTDAPTRTLDANIAVYPYESDLKCTSNEAEGGKTSYTISGITIPSTQRYVEGSFSNGQFLMTAITDSRNDHILKFKNIGGILKVQLTGNYKVKTIEICGNNGEKLSGEATLTLAKGESPVLTMNENASSTILMDCGEGVQLTEDVATPFYISVPPTAFTKGFHVLITDTEGNIDRMSTTKENIIDRSFIHNMPDVQTKTEAPGMACVIQGNDIYVRAKHFDESENKDLVWRLAKEQKSHNHFFNIANMFTCKSDITDTQATYTSNRTLWKSSGDDICPIRVWNEAIGGNHGYPCVNKLTVTNHGKEDADIGSVWKATYEKSGTNVTDYYVLVFVYDANTLGFIKYDAQSMANGKMNKNAVGSTTLSHHSNATNTDDIVIEKQATAQQLWRGSNHHVLKLYVDGIEKDINANAIHCGDRIEIVAEYDMIFVPAMLDYLMENVGKNTSESQYSDAIADSYFRLSSRYQFNRNGSISQYNTYTINKTFDVGHGCLVQSGPLPENNYQNYEGTEGATAPYATPPYCYFPDTVYDGMILHDDPKHEFKLVSSTWRDPQKVPYRYYQFSDENATKGMCLAYDRSIGWGKPEERIQHIIGDKAYAAYVPYTKKMYPAFFNGGTFTEGLSFEGLGCRIPVLKHDPDLTAMAWYWLGEDIILMLDSHKVVNKEIQLPDYMSGMQIEVLDSKNVEAPLLKGRKLSYLTGTNDYGYLVVKLSKQLRDFNLHPEEGNL